MRPHLFGTAVGLAALVLALLVAAGPATATPTWPFDRVEVAGTCGTIPGSVALRANRTEERRLHLGLLATGIPNGPWSGDIDLPDATRTSAYTFRQQVRRHTVREGGDFVLRREARSFSALLWSESDAELVCGVGGSFAPDWINVSAGPLEVAAQVDDGRLHLTTVGWRCRPESDWRLRVLIGARGHQERRSLGVVACRGGRYRAVGDWPSAGLPHRIEVVARSATGEVRRTSYRLGTPSPPSAS